MQSGFYSWYENLFNGCVEKDFYDLSSSDQSIYSQTITSLFSGKISSPIVVIRMHRPYDFKFSGAWPRSFKAFLYRQQNYHQILHDLYGDYLSPMLLREHRNLLSFIGGQPIKERSNVNKQLGSKLDLLLRVVLPESIEKSRFDLNDIFCGIFLWKRTYVLLLGDDVLNSLYTTDMKITIKEEKWLPLGLSSILLKVLLVTCNGESRLITQLPDFAGMEVSSECMSELHKEVDAVLVRLEMNYISNKLTNQLNIN